MVQQLKMIRYFLPLLQVRLLAILKIMILRILAVRLSHSQAHHQQFIRLFLHHQVERAQSKYRPINSPMLPATLTKQARYSVGRTMEKSQP